MRAVPTGRPPNSDFGFRPTAGAPSNLRTETPAFPGAPNAPPASTIPVPEMLYDTSGKRSNATVTYHCVVPMDGNFSYDEGHRRVETNQYQKTKHLRPGQLGFTYPDSQLGRRMGSGTEKMKQLVSFPYLSSATAAADKSNWTNKAPDGRGFIADNGGNLLPSEDARRDQTNLYDWVAADGVKQMLQEESGHQVLLIPEMSYCFPRGPPGVADANAQQVNNSAATTAFRMTPFLMWTDIYLANNLERLDGEFPWLQYAIEHISDEGRTAEKVNNYSTRPLPVDSSGDSAANLHATATAAQTQGKAPYELLHVPVATQGGKLVPDLTASGIRADSYGPVRFGYSATKLMAKYAEDGQLNGKPKACTVPVNELERTKQLWSDLYYENDNPLTTGAAQDPSARIVRAGLLSRRDSNGVGRFVPDGVVLYKYSTQGDNDQEEAELDDRQNGVYNMVVSGHALFTAWSELPMLDQNFPHPLGRASRRLVTLPRDIIYVVVTGIVAECVDLNTDKTLRSHSGTPIEGGFNKTTAGQYAVPASGKVIPDGRVAAQFNACIERARRVVDASALTAENIQDEWDSVPASEEPESTFFKRPDNDEKLRASWQTLSEQDGGPQDYKNAFHLPFERVEYARKNLVRRIISIRYQRTTSHELAEMCHARCQRSKGSFLGPREVILGAWRIGSVVDSAASRPVIPSSALGVPRTSSLPQLQGLTISTGIRWVSSFELHDLYWTPINGPGFPRGNPATTTRDAAGMTAWAREDAQQLHCPDVGSYAEPAGLTKELP